MPLLPGSAPFCLAVPLLPGSAPFARRCPFCQAMPLLPGDAHSLPTECLLSSIIATSTATFRVAQHTRQPVKHHQQQHPQQSHQCTTSGVFRGAPRTAGPAGGAHAVAAEGRRGAGAPEPGICQRQGPGACAGGHGSCGSLSCRRCCMLEQPPRAAPQLGAHGHGRIEVGAWVHGCVEVGAWVHGCIEVGVWSY